MDNLVLVCRCHHRLLHEGGVSLTKSEDNTLVFKRPDGQRIETNPGLKDTGSLNNLYEQNEHAGLLLDGKTLPIPPGDVMDYDMGVCGLLQSEVQQPPM